MNNINVVLQFEKSREEPQKTPCVRSATPAFIKTTRTQQSDVSMKY